MKNIEVAAFFEDIADLLEIKNDNPFKIRAYRKAAQNIRTLSEDIEAIYKKGGLEEIPGIGKDLAAKIVEILTTGRLKHYEKLKKEVPRGILDLMAVPGVGPKIAVTLNKKLGVKTIAQLEKAAKSHKIRALEHFKDKTEENILRGIDLARKRSERMTLQEALNLASEVISSLKRLPGVKRIIAAGSLRRMKETVRDIDILMTSASPKKIMDAFVRLPMAKEILAHGETKSSILTREGVQVDTRVVEPESFGAALVYFTGSKAHNIHMRHLAKKAGLKINEYGVFVEKSDKKIAGKEEADVYATLKMPLIEPELREDRGEIEAALKNRLPHLVKLSDIRGDLHIHTNRSDGEHSVKEMTEACRKRGYEYIAITDHSKTLKIAGGLSEKELAEEVAEIRRLGKGLKGFRVLAGIEVDILEDGSLGYDDSVLKTLDMVIGAVHSGFKQPREKLTRRILKAMENKYLNIIAHPTGRLMGSRPAYELDLEKIFKEAKAAGVAFEINSYPERLDLDDVNARTAKEAGVKVAISTDAHLMDQLDSMMLGVSVARRAWLSKADVLNTLPIGELLKFLRR